MSLPHPQKCPKCEGEYWDWDEHVSYMDGYCAGYKDRIRLNLRRTNWFNLTINIVGTTVILTSLLLLIQEIGSW